MPLPAKATKCGSSRNWDGDHVKRSFKTQQPPSCGIVVLNAASRMNCNLNTKTIPEATKKPTKCRSLDTKMIFILFGAQEE